MPEKGEDDYDRRLEALGSYYNSQHVAHVGYLLVIVAFILQVLLLLITTPALYSSLYSLSAVVLGLLCLIFAFTYSLARSQLYAVYSQILWELRGIAGTATQRAFSPATGVNLDRTSLVELIQFIMYVRLFAASKKWSKYFAYVGHTETFQIYHHDEEKKLEQLKNDLIAKGNTFRTRKLFRLMPLTWLLPVALLFTKVNLSDQTSPSTIVSGFTILWAGLWWTTPDMTETGPKSLT